MLHPMGTTYDRSGAGEGEGRERGGGNLHLEHTTRQGKTRRARGKAKPGKTRQDMETTRQEKIRQSQNVSLSASLGFDAFGLPAENAAIERSTTTNYEDHFPEICPFFFLFFFPSFYFINSHEPFRISPLFQ